MSIVIGIARKSVKTLLSTLWSYLSVILSDYYNLKIESTIDRQLTGVWLISCTVLLAAFSGVLRDLLIKPKPIYWIDSLEDLIKWEHLTIHTLDRSDLSWFMRNFPNDTMVEAFHKRIVTLSGDDFEQGRKSYDNDQDYEGVRDGMVAIVAQDIYLNVHKFNMVNKFNMTEDLDFHISRHEITQPIFAITNTIRINETMASVLDKV